MFRRQSQPLQSKKFRAKRLRLAPELPGTPPGARETCPKRMRVVSQLGNFSGQTVLCIHTPSQCLRERSFAGGRQQLYRLFSGRECRERHRQNPSSGSCPHEYSKSLPFVYSDNGACIQTAPVIVNIICLMLKAQRVSYYQIQRRGLSISATTIRYHRSLTIEV